MTRWLTGCWLAFALAAGADELAEAKAKFAKQDKALNAIYATLKKELAPETFAKVQEDQRGWLGYRDYFSERQAGEAAPEGSVERWETAAGLTEQRVEWLKAWRIQDQRKGWSGRYSDSRGGWLEIVEKDGRHHFSIQVVRGPTLHLGLIGGVLRVNQSLGWFETQSESGDEPTWLAFIEGGDARGTIRVHGANTNPFHGARAYFDGSYLWVGKLSPEEEKEVIEGKSYE